MRKNGIPQKKEPEQIAREFHERQSRQFIAIAAALFAVLLCGVVYKRPDLFGEFSKSALFSAQVFVIITFMVYTAFNWNCPSCGKYLGMDINKRYCKKCRTRLR